MLIPVERDFAVYPGFKFDPLFEFFEDAARTQPFNLTGFAAQMSIGNGLLVLTSSSGLTLGGVAGTVQVLATAAQTAGLPPGELAWSLSWTPSGGEPDFPAFGTVTVGMPVPTRG